MQIVALSKSLFNKFLEDQKVTSDNVAQQDKAFFISILNPDDDTPSYFSGETDNVKIMTFPDVDREMDVPVFKSNPAPDDKVEMMHLVPFTKDQARELYQFIKKHKDRDVCIIHCTAGVSRSGAVASFLLDYTGGNYEQFKRMNPQIQPNAHVYKMLHDEWYADIAYNDAITGKPVVERLPFPELLNELKNYHPEKRGNFEQFWLETDKFFEMVDESNLNVVEYCHPNFDGIMDCRKKVLPAGETELFAEFGHGEAYSGIILSEWLKGKNMLSYFNR